MVRLALRMIRHRPAGMLATVAALWLAVVVVTACGAMLESGIRYHGTVHRYAAAPVLVATTSLQTTEGSGEDRDVESTPLDQRGTLPADLPARLAAVPGVGAAVVDTAVPSRVGTTAVELHPWAAAALAPYRLRAGAAPAGTGQVVVDGRLGGVGERLSVPGLGAVTVTGTVGPTGAAPTVFATSVPGPPQVVGVLPAPGVSTVDLAAAVSRVLPHDADPHGAYPRVFTGAQRGTVESVQVGEGREFAIAVSSVFGGCALLIAILVIAGTVGLSVRQRHRDIALLRAIAATPRQVRRMVVRETVALGLLAGALGIGPGLLAARWLRDQYVERGILPGDFQARLSWLPPLVAAASALLVAIAAAWAASLRPSRVRPNQALAESVVERRRIGVLRLLLGVVALAGGVTLCIVSAQATGDNAAGTAVGTVFTLVVAVAFLAPLLIRLASATVGRLLAVFGAPGRLAAATTGASAYRLAAVLSALVLAVGLGGSLWFVWGSEQHAAAAQTAAGLRADYVVTGPVPAGAVTGVPGVAAATGVVRGTFWTGDTSYPAQGVDAATLPATVDLGVVAGRIADLRPGTVAVDTLTAASLRLHVGSHLQGWYGDGSVADLPVVAVYERGLGFAAVTLARETLAPHAPSQLDDAVFLRASPAGAAAVRSRLGVPVLARADYQVGLSDDLVQGGWTNRMITLVLVAYAVLAAVNTLILYAAGRRRELAVLRLSGATRPQLREMVRLEQVLLLGLALGLGAAVAAATLVPMVRGVTGGTPYVPVAGWGTVVGGVVLLGAVAALATRRAAAPPPASA